MEQPLAIPGQIVDTFANWSDGETSSAILQTGRMEVLRLHIGAGKHVPTYEAQGEIILFCVQGRVLVDALDERRELNSGQLLYLLVNEPFALHAAEETSMLITVLRPDGKPTIGDI